MSDFSQTKTSHLQESSRAKSLETKAVSAAFCLAKRLQSKGFMKTQRKEENLPGLYDVVYFEPSKMGADAYSVAMLANVSLLEAWVAVRRLEASDANSCPCVFLHVSEDPRQNVRVYQHK